MKRRPNRIRRMLMAAAIVAAAVPVAGAPPAAAQVDFTPLPGNGLYVPLTPARILDTRSAVGGHAAPFGQAETFALTVAGTGGVPATNVSAVALNVTVTEPTLPGHLTVWPSDRQKAETSNLNFAAGQTVPNMVIAKLSSSGRMSIFNSAGFTHVIVDVVGYFSDAIFSPVGASYQGLAPSRLLDTRAGLGAPAGALGQQSTMSLGVVGVGGVPATNVTAVALNVTVDVPTAPSHLTVWPAGEGLPLASNLNYRAGQTVPNMVLAKVGAGGHINIYNNAGSVHVIVDVVGYFTTQHALGQQVPLPPRRLLDTRIGLGAPTAPLGAARTLDLQVTGITDVPATGISAVALNVTVDRPTAPSYLTVFPSGSPVPLASNLNYVAGQTVPNMVIATVGAGGRITIYNNAGTTDVIVDLVGYYTAGVPYAANRGRTVPLLMSEWLVDPFLPVTDAPGIEATRDPGLRAQPLGAMGESTEESWSAILEHIEGRIVVPPTIATPTDHGPSGILAVNGYAPAAVDPSTGLLLQFIHQNSNPANIVEFAQCSATTVARNVVVTAFHCVRQLGIPVGWSFDSYLFAPGIHGVSAPFGYYRSFDPGWLLTDVTTIPDPFALLDLYPPLDYATIEFAPSPFSNPANTMPGDVVGYRDVLMESPGGPRLVLGYPGATSDCNPVAPNGNSCLQQFCFTTINRFLDYPTARGGAEAEVDCNVAPGMSGGPSLELYRTQLAVAGVVSNVFGAFMYGPYFEYDPVNGDIIDLLYCAHADFGSVFLSGCTVR